MREFGAATRNLGLVGLWDGYLSRGELPNLIAATGSETDCVVLNDTKTEREGTHPSLWSFGIYVYLIIGISSAIAIIYIMTNSY